MDPDKFKSVAINIKTYQMLEQLSQKKFEMPTRINRGLGPTLHNQLPWLIHAQILRSTNILDYGTEKRLNRFDAAGIDHLLILADRLTTHHASLQPQRTAVNMHYPISVCTSTQLLGQTRGVKVSQKSIVGNEALLH